MNHRTNILSFLATTCLSILCIVGGSAEAGGFASARFGGESAYPTSDKATGIYYNPAALSLGVGTRLYVEGLGVYRSGSYVRPIGAINNISDSETGTPSDAVRANSGKATFSNFLVSPFAAVVTDFGVKNLGVGLAAYVPFGGQGKWDRNDNYKGNDKYPGAVDGVQRWATMEGSIRALFLTAAGSYRLPGPRLSFGISFNLVSQSTDIIRARTALGTDDVIAKSGAVIEGRSRVNVSGLTFSAGLGIMWDPTETLRFGLSYQSQPGFGETKQTGVLTTKFGSGGIQDTDVEFLQSLPDIIRFGARLKAQSNWEFRFAADYHRWSVTDNQCLTDASVKDANCTLDNNGGPVQGKTSGVIVNVPRNWKDTFGLRLGSSYWLDNGIELTGSVGFDSNAVPDNTLDPSIIDMNKLIGVIGGQFALNESIKLSAGYTHVFYFTRTSAPRDRNPDGTEIGFPSPSTVPDHAGTYKLLTGLLNIGLEYSF